MLSLQEIFTEADTLMPNEYVNLDKVRWMNMLNNEFFDIVKIPITSTFTSISGTNTYVLAGASGTIKEKTMDKVIVGNLKYRNLNYEDVQPMENWFTFNEVDNILTLSSAPSRNGITGIARHRRTATTSYIVDNISIVYPDAPEEYHWIYALGLASYIAKAQEEDEKAANYGAQYRAALQVAAQNFQKEAAT